MEEIREKINKKLEKNILFQKSSTPFKYIQGEFYSNGAELRNGYEAEKYEIDGKLMNVIIHYVDGYINSDGEEPAIQWDGHWEYWNKGMIVKVVDKDGDTEEYWEKGVPVRIERNLKQRRINGEDI